MAVYFYVCKCGHKQIHHLVGHCVVCDCHNYTKGTEWDVLDGLNDLAADIHAAMRDKGFWNEPRSSGELIALMHSELSECLEGMRHGNPPSEHIPDFSSEEEELADVIIRILDMAGAHGLNLDGALEAKMKFNIGRPYKHGKEF